MGNAWLVAGVAVLLAGCVQAPPKDLFAPKEKVLPPPETFVYDEEACNVYVLGLLVEPSLTDRYLPPGFHLRDPEWFYESPVPRAPPPPLLPPVPPPQAATGQALVVNLLFLCDPPSEPGSVPFSESHVGVFVLPPAVRGQRDNATLDIYEVDHYSQGDGLLRQRLPAWEWPVHNTTFTQEAASEQARNLQLSRQVGPVSVPNGVPIPPYHTDNGTADNLRELEFLVHAAQRSTIPASPLSDPLDNGVLFGFGGSTGGAVDYKIPSIRFWHQAKAGLSHIDYLLPMDVHLGPGYCKFQRGSTLSNLTGLEVCPQIQSPDSDPSAIPSFRPKETVPFVGYFRTAFRAEATRQQEVFAK